MILYRLRGGNTLSPSIAKTALAILVATWLSGCVILPLPEHEWLSPAVDGTVHRNGKPVAGARLYVEDRLYARDGPCAYQGKPVAQSDAKGVFHIPERQRMGYVIATAMEPPLPSGWRVCIADGDRHYEGWYEEVYMHHERFSLDCSLESAPQTWGWPAWRGGTYKVRGICRSPQDEAAGKLKLLPESPAAGPPASGP